MFRTVDGDQIAAEPLPKPGRAATSGADLQRHLGAVINGMVEAWRARYGEVVCDLTVTVANRSHPASLAVVLDGSVLLAAQRDAVLAAVAGAIPADAALDGEGVRVLADAGESLAWLIPAADVVNVLTGPSGGLSTQVLPHDPPLRLLAERQPWGVVQAADGTLGWVDLGSTKAAGEAARPESVDRWRNDFKGHYVAASGDAWLKAADDWAGVPYLWGGATRAGIDCSGLSQRLYRELCGLGLPKHSADQAAAGRRLALEALDVGDLVYLTRIDGGVKHVAIAIDRQGPLMLHASREQGVAREPLDQLLGRYRFRGAVRFGPPFGMQRP